MGHRISSVYARTFEKVIDIKTFIMSYIMSLKIPKNDVLHYIGIITFITFIGNDVLHLLH